MKYDSANIAYLLRANLRMAGGRIFPDFDAFIKEVNKVPTAVSGRYLMSSTLKPHIVFSIPRSIISDGNNEVMLTLYAGSDSVSAETRITVGSSTH